MSLLLIRGLPLSGEYDCLHGDIYRVPKCVTSGARAHFIAYFPIIVCKLEWKNSGADVAYDLN